jgi:hypothetical protein
MFSCVLYWTDTDFEKNRVEFMVLILHLLRLQGSADENFRHFDERPPVQTAWQTRRLQSWASPLKGISAPSPGSPPSILYTGYRVFFRGVKWTGRGVAWRDVDHPTVTSSTEVTEIVELYFYSSSTTHLWL